MKITRIAIVCLLASALPGVVAANTQPGRIEVQTVVEREVVVEKPDGTKEKKLVPAEKVIPGDEVVYTIRVKNISEEPVENVVITDPVPEHTYYQPGSAEGTSTDVQFSIDGGTTYGKAERLMVKLADGKTRPATAEDYTHIRWTFKADIAPGDVERVRFRAKLQ